MPAFPPIDEQTAMRINFLTADKPLAKSFTPETKTPYPLISQFTSHSFDITDITEFFHLINKFAAKGGCLVKGELLHPLNNESRAGSTSADTLTSYSCFDVDRCHPSIKTPEEFIERCLPEAFQDVSFIWQWSNSAKITKHCLAGHLFFLHKKPINAKLLKQFYTDLNFNSDALEQEIRLSHNGQTLSYGLDPTTAQNDKLLFIANPILTGIKDPFEERIFLVHRTNPFVTIEPKDLEFTPLAGKTRNKLNALRLAANLPKKQGKFKNEAGYSILTNPEKAVFRGPYSRARGFVYGNLNNGDSYAYYHTEEKPYYLYNFKGEPIVRLQDIDPDYWNELHKAVLASQDYIAFRDRRTDTFYTLTYDKQNDAYEMYKVSNEKKAFDFLLIKGQPLPETIPLWDVVFNPAKDLLVDYDNQTVNTYQKTDILKNAIPSGYCPPKFMELVTHVVGNDPEIRDDLINWLAFIIQRREKTKTAFILQGRTGTGKGVLFHEILKPILGPNHCAMIMMEDIDSSFTEWLQNTILVVVDEAQVNDDQHKSKKRMNKIKNLITEPTCQLRIKNVSNIQYENFASFVFTSNEHDSIHLAENDRRFKVGARQEEKLDYNDDDINEIQLIVQDVANYLIGYPFNEDKVRAVITTEARQKLIDASKSSIEEFLTIIKTGDLDQFLQYSGEFATLRNAEYKDAYEKLLIKWGAQTDTLIWIPTTDLRIAFNYVFNMDMSFAKFGSFLRANGITIIDHRHPGLGVLRSTPVTWKSNVFHSSIEQMPSCGHLVN